MKTELYNKAIENIHNIVGQAVLKQIPTLDHIMGVENMSETDKVWYEAYKKYGNRNHTWQDFRDMFYGNVDVMKKTVKNWKTWDEINDFTFKSNNLLYALKDMLKKYDIRLTRESDIEKNKYKYPDFFEAYEEYLKLEVKRQPNYSTFNPEYAKIEREFEKKIAAIAKDDSQAQINLIAEYLQKIDEYIDLKNGDFVVGERIELYRKIILKDPKILMIAQKFNNLSVDEKFDLARMILNKSAEYAGTPTGTVEQDDALVGPHLLTKSQAGGYQKGRIRFLFKSDAKAFSDLLSFFMVLAHEDAHRIDYYNENYGMIGTQLMKFVNKNYNDNERIGHALYKKFATEQSSYYLDGTTGAALEYMVQHHQNS